METTAFQINFVGSPLDFILAWFLLGKRIFPLPRMGSTTGFSLFDGIFRSLLVLYLHQAAVTPARGAAILPPLTILDHSTCRSKTSRSFARPW